MRASWLALLVACAPRIDPGPTPILRAAEPVAIVDRTDATRGATADDASPNVVIQAVVRAGSAWDPPGREGLAALTARAMIEAGAGERSGPALRDALFPTGNAIELVVDKELVSFRLRCHRDHAALCAELFTDVLTRPLFRDADVQRLAEQAAHAVGVGLIADEEALGEAALHGALFEAHPYAHPVRGRAGAVTLLDGERLRAFHAARYRRSTVTVGLAGSWSADDRDAIERALLALSPGLAPALTLPPPNAPVGRGLIAIDTGTPVTGFHVGHPLDVRRDHPDWVALVVGVTALGQHRQSFGRLFRSLRADRGLTYGAYAYAEPFVQRGWQPLPEQGIARRDRHFSIWIRPTSPENAPFALKLALDELERWVDAGLSDDEFSRTVAWLERHTALQATDPGRRLAWALDAAVTGEPDPLDALPRALPSLTRADVNAAIRAHIDPANLWIVAVGGDMESFAATLIEDRPTPVVYADIAPGPAQAARDAEIAARSAGLDPARVHVLPAEGIFR